MKRKWIEILEPVLRFVQLDRLVYKPSPFAWKQALFYLVQMNSLIEYEMMDTLLTCQAIPTCQFAGQWPKIQSSG